MAKALGAHAPSIVVTDALTSLRNVLSITANLPVTRGYFEVTGFMVIDGRTRVEIVFSEQVLADPRGIDLMMQAFITSSAIEECGTNAMTVPHRRTGWILLASV